MKNEVARLERNYGIDLLRIVAMFYVVILHILGYGGVSENATTHVAIGIVTFIRAGAFCAVNCYALISGYVIYTEEKKTYRYSKYIELWLQAVFYGVLGAGTFLIISPDLLYIKHLILAFFPITSNQWWYFTAYTGLFFLIPWLNRFVRTLSEKEMERLIIVLFFLFSVYPTIAALFKEPFNLNEGYSMIWIVIMYLFGAWLKKNSVLERMSVKKWLVIGLICFLITWITKLFFVLSGDSKTLFLQSYISPTIVCISIIHLMVFSKLKIKPILQKWIAYFSPAAFGVYLLHMQWDILDNLITTRLRFIGHLPSWQIPITILSIAFLITMVGLIIDKIREKIFCILKIRNWAYTIEMKMKRL